MTRETRKTTTKRSEKHSDLIREVGLEIRQLGAQSVMMSQTIASRFGLHTTDLEGLDLIYLRTQVTAGELASATGLTSGSVTALIDRLERAGYVERVHDSADRRRVLVRIKPQAIKPIEAVYAPIQERMFALWSRFSADDLARVLAFLRSSREVGLACATELAHDSPAKARRRPRRTSD